MVNAWFIRVDGSYESLIEFYSKFILKTERVLIYEHPVTDNGKSVHTHALFIGATFSKQTFYDSVKVVKHIADELDSKKRANMYYCKAMKHMETCIKYMSKGKYDPVFKKDFEDSSLETYKEMAYDKSDVKKAGAEAATKTEQGSAKSLPRTKRYTVLDFQYECIEACAELTKNGKAHITDCLKRDIIMKIRELNERIGREKRFGRIHDRFVVEIAQAVMIEYYPAYVADRLISRF